MECVNNQHRSRYRMSLFLLLLFGIVLFLIAQSKEVYLYAVTVTPTVTPTPTPVPRLIELTATYEGTDTILVGEDIELDKIKVQGTFSDGNVEPIKEYTLSNKTVKSIGLNQFVVMYQGKSAVFWLSGKKVTSISAYYIGGTVSIGNSADPRMVMATATYSDGSMETVTDFLLFNDVIRTPEENKVSLRYGDVLSTFSVYGMAPKEILSLSVTYDGKSVPVGSTIQKRSLSVIAAYKDGTTEVINNYTLSPDKITAQGAQQVIAAYRGLTATFTATGIEKTITGIKATYKGEPVAVGYSVRRSDIQVIATYNDGSTEVITDFNIMSSAITYAGYHTITVEASGSTAEFIVQGIAEENISYNNAAIFDITNGTHDGSVALSLYSNLDKTKFGGSSVEPYEVRKLMRRAVKYSSFIAFEVELSEIDLVEEFPMTIKITLPDAYKTKGCSVFYTPNRKSVLGELLYEVTGTNELTCKIYNPGTYIVSYLK